MTEKKVRIDVPKSSAKLFEANNLSTAKFYEMVQKTDEFFEKLAKEMEVNASLQWEVMSFRLALKARHKLDLDVFGWVTSEWCKAINDARHRETAAKVIKDE